MTGKFPILVRAGVTVGSVLQPTGPLPTTVYWRRRAAAIAGLVLLLVGLIWLVAEVAGGEPGQPAPPAPPPEQQPSSTAESTTDQSATVAVSSTTGPPASSDAAAAAAGSAPPASQAPPSPTPTQPPGPPQPCPDEITKVTAQPEQPEYRVGTKPVFRLTVTNTGTAPCTRNLDAGLQELLVYAADGTTRLWSSNDCYPGDSVDVRTLQPGENVNFTVTWAGRSSRPNCTGQRVQIPAGDYLVVGKLGPLTGAPAPFRLTP